jgi:hypothetical protein
VMSTPLPLQLRSLSSASYSNPPTAITRSPLGISCTTNYTSIFTRQFPSLHISTRKTLAHLNAVAHTAPTSMKPGTPPNTISPSPLRKQNTPSTPLQTIITHQLPRILRLGHNVFLYLC